MLLAQGSVAVGIHLEDARNEDIARELWFQQKVINGDLATSIC